VPKKSKPDDAAAPTSTPQESSAPPKPKKTFEPLKRELVKNIPDELRALRQWVGWKLEFKDDGKANKRPVDASTGYYASTTDKSKYSTFDVALESIAKFGLMGVGFVFTREDNYVGVDLDACRDKTTGELESWAQHVVDQFDTYSEVSPSGTGIKMIVRGKLPGEGNRRGAIEMYEHGRFFTITGAIPTEHPRPIAERQAAIDALYREHIAIQPAEAYQAAPPPIDDADLDAIRAIPDKQLIRIASNAANGKKFKDLWDGSAAAYGDDQSSADLALCSLLAFYTGRDVARIDRLFRQSGLIRKKWDERHGAQTYGEKTIAKAISGTRVVYDPSTRLSELNDTLNAEIFIELHSDALCYCSMWKTWLSWEGTHWNYHSGVENSRAYNATSNVQKYLLEKAADEPGEQRRKQLQKWGVQSGDKYKRDAMLYIAAQRSDLPPSIFDRDPMLIAAKNGVVDMRKECGPNERFRPARREDYITRCAGANFDLKKECPTFNKFLFDVMQGDDEMIKYIWRVMGYALTGDIRERAFFILHGGGRNGKTTFLELLMALGGTYAQKARFSSFLKKKNDAGPNDDIAHMVGSRIIVASEAEEGAALNTSLIKEMTGGDAIRARFLYGKEFEFRPVAKFFFATNAIPNIYESTEAIWDRIHCIPFTYRIPDDKIDKMLGLKLREELDAIFSQAVMYCAIWQAIGNLLPPDKVRKSVSHLREEMDVFGEWLNECVEPFETTNDALTRVGETYNNYREWNEKTRGKGMKPRSKIALVRYLASHGVNVEPGTDNVKFFKGLALRLISPRI